MNAVLVLVVVVGSCACGVLPQPTQITHLLQDARVNYTQHVAIHEKETKVQSDEITLDKEVKKDTRMHDYKSEGVKGVKDIRRSSRAHDRFQYILKDTEAKILEMNKRHPNRGELKTLPGLERLKQEASQINAISTPHSKDCVFVCPDDESLAPCSCDPCERSLNCSMVTSFEQLYDVFHSTYFPETRFTQFLLVAPFRMSKTATTTRSDTFLAHTFGNISFTTVRVEEVTQLTVVEDGAFSGSEETLKEITFKWNSVLKSFPFTEIEKMDVLDRLEVRGSSITSVPVLPFNLHLTKLFLSDNYFMTNIPQKAFAQLPNLLFLDLGFSSLQTLQEDSLYFSSQNLMLFLDHNSIDAFHENTFSGFPPSALDVSSNNLAALDQRVFQPILDHIIAQQYDSYIDATYNPLQCGNLGWLMENSFYLSYILLSDPPCM